MKIHFKISPERKNKHISSNFNPRLSEYWKTQLRDLFKKW